MDFSSWVAYSFLGKAIGFGVFVLPVYLLVRFIKLMASKADDQNPGSEPLDDDVSAKTKEEGE